MGRTEGLGSSQSQNLGDCSASGSHEQTMRTKLQMGMKWGFVHGEGISVSFLCRWALANPGKPSQ